MLSGPGRIHFLQPFTSPQFVHYRLSEYASKGLSGLLAYVTPRVPYAAFNLEAAAEWAWNARGRAVREFALSWAMRRGLAQPERFADWCELLGPVTWDVHGAAWPTNRLRGTQERPMLALMAGVLPELGFVRWGCYPESWGQIKSEEQLRTNWAAAKQAIALAEELGLPEAVYESRVIEGYVAALVALWELRGCVAASAVVPGREEEACAAFAGYLAGLERAGRPSRHGPGQCSRMRTPRSSWRARWTR